MPEDFSVANVLRDAARVDDHGPPTKTKLSVTDLLGPCLLKVRHKVETPPVYDDETNLSFLRGHILHRGIQDCFPKSPDTVHEERIERQLLTTHDGKTATATIRGYADTWRKEAGEVIDFKTTRSLKYTRAAPKPRDVEQVNTYLGLLRTRGESVGFGRVVYVDVGSLECAEHRFEFDPKLWDRTMDKGHLLNRVLNMGSGEELPTAQEKWECDYCPYRTTCEASMSKGDTL